MSIPEAAPCHFLADIPAPFLHLQDFSSTKQKQFRASLEIKMGRPFLRALPYFILSLPAGGAAAHFRIGLHRPRGRLACRRNIFSSRPLHNFFRAVNLLGSIAM